MGRFLHEGPLTFNATSMQCSFVTNPENARSQLLAWGTSAAGPLLRGRRHRGVSREARAASGAGGCAGPQPPLAATLARHGRDPTALGPR